MLRKTFFKLFRIINMNYFFQRSKFAQLYILMFHRINDNNFNFYPAIPNHAFEQICGFFSKRFEVIYFSEIDDYFKKTRKSAAVITFDDGYYDILENAYPILVKYKLKFNINIVTESIETGLPNDNIIVYDVLNSTEKKEYINNEILPEPIKISIDKSFPAKTEAGFARLFQRLNKKQRRLISNDVINKLANTSTKFSPMLSSEDIIYLNKEGAEIGSHTHSHSILANIDISEIEFELTHSKKVLEDLCGTDINIIAFPQGKYNKAVIQKSFDSGYKYLLLADDRKNIIIDTKDNIYHRIGLYHKTLDENLAKIFGFHQAIYNLKGSLK